MSSLPQCIAAALLFAAASAGAQEPPAARVVLGPDTLVVEVADEYPERVRGLQGRTEVPDGTGMLFRWSEPSAQSFWMYNTGIDLDIAFIDASLRIVKLATMRAGSTETVDSGVPILYALEVRAGWFEERGVQVGDRVRILREREPGGGPAGGLGSSRRPPRAPR